MTLISVGSTGTPGPQGARGSAGSDGAAPSGFEELLAGAHPAHEAHPDPAHEAANDSSRDKSSGDKPCDVAAHAPASTTDDAGATGKADSTDDSTSDDTPKKPDGSDPAGVLAALAVPVPTAPTATIPPTAADATSTGTAATTDATATVIDPSVIADATDASATPTVDLAAVLAALPTEDAPPSVEPVLLPLPDLTATSARTGADTTHASAATRESFAPPPTASATAEHARPTPASLPQTTGAATFAAPPPPPVASAAMANVNTEAETAAAARTLPPPSEQLVSVLTPLRTTQNGTYTLRLELKPPELGRVEMRVEMRDGVLHASIHAEQHNSAQVLRDALSDLRERLGSEGVHTGELTVSDGSVGSRQPGSGRTPESRGAQLDLPANDSLEPTDPPNLSPPLDPEATSLLDVRV